MSCFNLYIVFLFFCFILGWVKLLFDDWLDGNLKRINFVLSLYFYILGLEEVIWVL